MSYNIDSVKQKKLENLIIPFKALYKAERKDWHPEQPKIIDIEKNLVSIECGCGQSINGILKDGNIHVTEMHLAGEGSGSLMHYVIEPALKESTGIYEAIMIWEGGDSITKFTVNNGEVKDEPYEL